MSEPEALRQRRGLLLESIGKAADEFGRNGGRGDSIKTNMWWHRLLYQNTAYGKFGSFKKES